VKLFIRHEIDGRGNVLSSRKFNEEDETIPEFVFKNLTVGGMTRIDCVKAIGGKVSWALHDATETQQIAARARHLARKAATERR
jgi:hypothetical protein